jgi:hypothetical protein
MQPTTIQHLISFLIAQWVLKVETLYFCDTEFGDTRRKWLILKHVHTQTIGLSDCLCEYNCYSFEGVYSGARREWQMIHDCEQQNIENKQQTYILISIGIPHFQVYNDTTFQKCMPMVHFQTGYTINIWPQCMLSAD